MAFQAGGAGMHYSIFRGNICFPILCSMLRLAPLKLFQEEIISEKVTFFKDCDSLVVFKNNLNCDLIRLPCYKVTARDISDATGVNRAPKTNDDADACGTSQNDPHLS